MSIKIQNGKEVRIFNRNALWRAVKHVGTDIWTYVWWLVVLMFHYIYMSQITGITGNTAFALYLTSDFIFVNVYRVVGYYLGSTYGGRKLKKSSVLSYVSMAVVITIVAIIGGAFTSYALIRFGLLSNTPYGNPGGVTGLWESIPHLLLAGGAITLSFFPGRRAGTDMVVAAQMSRR